MARDDVVIRIGGDASKLSRALGGAETRLSKFGRNVGGTARKAGKALAIGLGGAIGGIAAAAGGTLKVGFGEVQEAQSNAARTTNVLKTTGGAAHVTAKQVSGLAQGIEDLTGIDGDNVQAGENLLLTFTNLRNEVGAGNDIFTQSTEIMTDMSSALGQDMKTSAIQVGKALNDPIKGVTALQRVGVSFTQQQKDQIKALVESGDTLGAQKLILKELQKEFGGAAKAAGSTLQGRIEKLKRKFEGLAASLVEKLVPFIEDTIGFLDKLGDKVGPVAKKVADTVTNIIDSFRSGGKGSDDLRTKFEGVRSTVQRVWPQVQAQISDVMNTVRTIISGVVAVIETIWQNFGNNIVEFVQRVWPPIAQIIRGALQVIRGVVLVITSLIRGDWSGAWNAMKQLIRGVLNLIVGIVKGAFEVIRFIIGVALEIIGSAIKGAWRAAWNETKLWFGKIVDFILGLPGKIIGIHVAIFNAAKGIGSKIFDGVKAGFGFAGDLLKGLKHAFDVAILGPIRSGIHTLANALADVNIPGVGRAFDKASSLLNSTADAIHLASGGIVRARPGGVLANIAEGGRDEAVIPLPRRGETGMLTGIQIGTVVLGNGAQTSDLIRELRWYELTGRGRGR